MRIIAFVALCVFCSLAVAKADPAAAPILSGAYVYNWLESCSSNPSPTFESGTVTFHTAKKTATLDANKTSGSTSFTLTPLVGTVAYSNTSTTVTFNVGTVSAQTYQATYGALTGGVAVNASWIGLSQSASCEDMAWVTRQ